MSTNLKSYLRKGKKGILLGVALGLAASWMLASQGADLNFTLQSVGLVDQMVATGQTATKLAFTKTAIFFMTVGGFAGLIIWNKD